MAGPQVIPYKGSLAHLYLLPSDTTHIYMPPRNTICIHIHTATQEILHTRILSVGAKRTSFSHKGPDFPPAFLFIFVSGHMGVLRTCLVLCTLGSLLESLGTI